MRAVAVTAFAVCLPFVLKFLGFYLAELYGILPFDWLLDRIILLSGVVRDAALYLLSPIGDFLRDLLSSMAGRIRELMAPELRLVWMLVAPIVDLVSDLVSALGRLLPECLWRLFDLAAWLARSLVWLTGLVLFGTPAVIEAWVRDHSPGWFFAFFLAIRFAAGFAVVAGFCVAGFLAFYPKFASARAYGYVDPRNRSAVIIFCGSVGWDNITINAHVWQRFFPPHHFGFRRAWTHIRPRVIEWLTKPGAGFDHVVLSGHSLGGAVAQIAALDLSKDFCVRRVVSFGSSRIGGRRLRREYNATPLYGRTFHLTHDDDAIPRLPPALLFKHVGRRFALSRDGTLNETTPGPLFQKYRDLWNRKTGDDTSVEFETNNRDPRFLLEPDPEPGFSSWRLRQTTPEQQAAYAARSDHRAGIPRRNFDLAWNAIRAIFSKDMPRARKFRMSFRVLLGFARHTYPNEMWLHLIAFTVFDTGVYVAGLGLYYVRMFWKGMAVDHGAALYREALAPSKAPTGGGG